MKPVEFINSDNLHGNSAFSQIAITNGTGRTIYIGGQNAVTADGGITGKGELGVQTRQALSNLKEALRASGAHTDDLFKLTIYIVQGEDVRQGFEASRQFLAGLKNPPVITVLMVAGLAHPDFLVEIEAIAFKALR